MSVSGRGTTPQFNPSKFRGAPPELADLIEKTLANPTEVQLQEGSKTELITTSSNLDSFVVKKGSASAKVLGFEAMQQNLRVDWINTDGKQESAEVSSDLLTLVQKRNRALTQLETFLQEQLAEGKLPSDRKSKLEEILGNVSEYQSNLMRSIDQELKLSEKVAQSDA